MSRIPGIEVGTGIKSGGCGSSGVKLNHNTTTAGIAVRTGVKAGPGFGGNGIYLNHNTNTAGVAVRTGIKAGPGFGAGGVYLNHNTNRTN